MHYYYVVVPVSWYSKCLLKRERSQNQIKLAQATSAIHQTNENERNKFYLNIGNPFFGLTEPPITLFFVSMGFISLFYLNSLPCSWAWCTKNAADNKKKNEIGKDVNGEIKKNERIG